MKDDREKMLDEINSLKKSFIDMRQRANELIAGFTNVLKKEDLKKVMEKQSTDYLNYLLFSVGEKIENYELCQIIKEVLEERKE